MSESNFVLGVDLDGVVADFYGGLRPIAAKWLEVPIETLATDVSYGLPEWSLDAERYKDLHRHAVTQHELFLSLSPITGAATTLRRLWNDHDVRIRIITHRLFISYSHQKAVRQTVEWLDRHDIPYWDLCFMKNKAAVGADMYIEDTADNVEALRKDGHKTIVFTNSTNKGVDPPRADTWQDVERLVLEELSVWRDGKALGAGAKS